MPADEKKPDVEKKTLSEAAAEYCESHQASEWTSWSHEFSHELANRPFLNDLSHFVGDFYRFTAETVSFCGRERERSSLLCQ